MEKNLFSIYIVFFITNLDISLQRSDFRDLYNSIKNLFNNYFEKHDLLLLLFMIHDDDMIEIKSEWTLKYNMVV